MKQRRQFQNSDQVVAGRTKRSRRRSLRKLPEYRPDLSMEDPGEREKKVDEFSSRIKTELKVHFGLSTGDPPWFDSFQFMYQEDLANLIASATIAPTGHGVSRDCTWIGHGFVLCACDSTLLRREDGDNWLAQNFLFGEKGELLRDAVVEGFGPPTGVILDAIAKQHMLGPPTLIRAPNERRPLTAEEAWGCISALMRAFVTFRPSLYKFADSAAINDLHDRAEDARSLAVRLRQPARWGWGMSYLEDVLTILCERYAFSLDEFRYQMEGKKEKEALVRFMGPCVACFEHLFGQQASGGGDYKPSPFTLFVSAFLTKMDVPEISSRTVRTYFQRWHKLSHRACPTA